MNDAPTSHRCPKCRRQTLDNHSVNGKRGYCQGCVEWFTLQRWAADQAARNAETEGRR